MIRVWKSAASKSVFISGVTFCPTDDIEYLRNGDLFTLDRTSTEITEVKDVPYSQFGDEQNNSFPDADAFEAYLQSILVTEELAVSGKDLYCAYIQSELGLINQTTAFEPFFIRESLPNVSNGVWSWTVPEDGDYEMTLSYRWSYNNTTTTSFLAHVLRNGSIFDFPLHIEPKDSGGTGVTLPTVVNGIVTINVNSGTDQFHLAYGKRILQNLTKGDVETFKLEFACQNASQEATIYNATISIKAIKNRNV